MDVQLRNPLRDSPRPKGPRVNSTTADPLEMAEMLGSSVQGTPTQLLWAPVAVHPELPWATSASAFPGSAALEPPSLSTLPTRSFCSRGDPRMQHCSTKASGVPSQALFVPGDQKAHTSQGRGLLLLPV